MASPMPLVPPMIATFLPSHRFMCISLVDLRSVVVIPKLGIWRCCLHQVARRNQRSSQTPRSRMVVRQVHAGDLDDRLPRGFLTGAIVEVWLALHFDWARELPFGRGKELP